MTEPTTTRRMGLGKLLKLGLVAALAWVAWSEHQKADAVRMEAGWLRKLNDSTQAVTAAREIQHRQEMETLTQAAKQLKGKLVAGVTFTTKADTATKPLQEVIPSSVAPDGTRIAELVDTTKMGIQVRIQAEAPPAPANLRLGYTLVVPEFKPSIGFVRTGRTYAAVVSWANQEITVKDAFYIPDGTAPAPKWTLSTSSTVGGEYGLLRKPDWSMHLDRRITEKTKLRVSGTASWYTGQQLTVSVTRMLWSSR